MTPPAPPPAAVQIVARAVQYLTGRPELYAQPAVAALAEAGLLDPDARLREAVAALRAKTDQYGGVPWLEPELGAVYAALDAAPTPDPYGDPELRNHRGHTGEGRPDCPYCPSPGEDAAAETGEQLAARDTAGSGEA